MAKEQLSFTTRKLSLYLYIYLNIIHIYMIYMHC